LLASQRSNLNAAYSLVSPDGPSITISHHFHSLLISRDEATGQDVLQSCAGEEHNPDITSLETTQKQANVVQSLRGQHKQDGEGELQEPSLLGKFHAGTEASLQDSCREMARGYTTGLKAGELEDILLKASGFESVGGRKREREPGSSFSPMLHPKAILLGALENFESELRSRITNYQNFIKDKSEEIKVQRRPENKNGDGLVRCSIYLSESNVELGLLRPKAQYLATSLTALESCVGIPHSDDDLAFLFPTSKTSDGMVAKLENPFADHWVRQLSNINARLLDLKVKCEHCKADLETLQHRVTGSLMMVRNLSSVTPWTAF
jgi:hypothetical protein